MLHLSKAIELVVQLDRTRKYPGDDEGVKRLAHGLQKASDTCNVAGARIVEKCAEISEWCPTDADMLNVARDLARLDAVAAGTYDALSRASEHVRAPGAPVCEECGGTGWRIVWTLRTRKGEGRASAWEPKRITEAQARELMPTLDQQKQQIHDAAVRCTCPVPADASIPQERKPATRHEHPNDADWQRRAAGDQ